MVSMLQENLFVGAFERTRPVGTAAAWAAHGRYD